MRAQFKIVVVLVGAAMGAAAISCSRSPYDLTEKEARHLVDSLLIKPSDFVLWLGHVNFINTALSDRRLQPGEDQFTELPLYEAMAADGMITIKNRRDLTDRFTGWNDWFSLTQNGVRVTAIIEATDDGRKQHVVQSVDGHDYLTANIGVRRLDRIVTNDTIRIGTDLYRTVSGTYTHEVPQEYQDAFKKARHWSGPESRFVMLFKYDPFAKGWAALAADKVEGAPDFSTDHVGNAIAQLRMCAQLGC